MHATENVGVPNKPNVWGVYDRGKRRDKTIVLYEFVESTIFCRKKIEETCILWVLQKFLILMSYDTLRGTRSILWNFLGSA